MGGTVLDRNTDVHSHSPTHYFAPGSPSVLLPTTNGE